MRRIFALGAMVLTAVAGAQWLKPDPRIYGTWVAIQPDKAKEEVRFEKDGSFTFYAAGVQYRGFYSVKPVPAGLRQGWKPTMMIERYIDLATARKTGTSTAEIARFKKARQTMVAMTPRYLFMPTFPIIADTGTTVFAPKGREAEVKKRYSSMQKFLHWSRRQRP